MAKTILSFPLIASPMDTVCSPELVEELALRGMVGFLHRNMSKNEKIKAIQDFTFKHRPKSQLKGYNKWVNYGIAVSTQLEDIEEILTFTLQHDLGVEFPALRLWVVIDTANGFHSSTEEAILKLRNMDIYQKLKDRIILMVGNVASKEGFQWLSSFPEVDAVRVGISNGSPCTTGLVTGMGQGIVSTIQECCSVPTDVAIIADGSIKHTGDIAKALAVGATAVMAGSLFAGYDISAGKLIKPPRSKKKPHLWKKEFRGMASYGAALDSQKMSGSTKAILPEGEAVAINYKGPIKPFLDSLQPALRSAMSYQNATHIEEFRRNIISTDAISCQTYFSHIERTPFIKYATQ